MRKMMAFWKYNTFPFILSGELLDFTDKGNVKIKGYDGMAFKPLFLLSYEEGLHLKEQLEQLRCEHRQDIQNLNNLYNDKVMTLINKYDADYKI